MIVASGFVEVDGLNNLERAISELKIRGIQINDIENEKVIFLIERENIEKVKTELDSLRKVDSIKNVYITYYSLEEGDEEL